MEAVKDLAVRGWQFLWAPKGSYINHLPRRKVLLNLCDQKRCVRASGIRAGSTVVLDYRYQESWPWKRRCAEGALERAARISMHLLRVIV